MQRGRPAARPPGAQRAAMLWASLPRELRARFRPHAEILARHILAEVQRCVPEYARPLEGAFGALITKGIRNAILHGLECIGDDRAKDRSDFFRYLGYVEFQEGRDLDCLHAAYRIGGRVAWRYIAELGRAGKVPPDVLFVCAESLFAYVDEMSELSSEGYQAAQASSRVGARERRRRKLLQVVLSGAETSPHALSGLAAAGNWSVPESLSVVVFDKPGGGAVPIALPTGDDDVLVDLSGAEPCLVTSDPRRHLAEFAAAPAGWRAAVGPRVRLGDAPLSLKWARRSLELARRGLFGEGPVVWFAEELSSLWLLADEFLADAMAERCLAPLAPLTEKQRARLSETLLAWLDSRGGAPEVAAKLHVHPQTIRNRMHQLERLFGDRLSCPEERFAMMVALRAQRLLASAG
ncbi:helix-turn-helix domain-containing protein [Amycolatopsis arida]|uniref:PucR family transcriptional regulator n=1 Tax=Amycolatopsis arida TaxID=587909 RepID=UPI001FCFCA18|nr:PucR family transcriptional regulator [Amycolatopsis arida]